MMQLRVAPSQAKNKLFIGNIPKGYDSAEVERQLKEHVKGVLGHAALIMRRACISEQAAFGLGLHVRTAALRMCMQ